MADYDPKEAEKKKERERERDRQRNDNKYDERSQDRNYSDDNTTYNNGDNLTGNDNLDTHVWQKDPDLEKQKFKNEYIADKLEKAIKRTGRQYTHIGLDLLSAKVEEIDGDLYLKWKGKYLKITGEKGELLTYQEIKNKYDKAVSNYIKITIKTKGENIEMRPMDNRPMDNEASRSQPQQISTEEQLAITSFVEKIDTSPVKLVKYLTDATDEELRAVGFTEQHIREIKGILEFVDNAFKL